MTESSVGYICMGNEIKEIGDSVLQQVEILQAKNKQVRVLCSTRNWRSYMFTASHVQRLQMIFLAYANAASANAITLLNQNVSSPRTLTHSLP